MNKFQIEEEMIQESVIDSYQIVMAQPYIIEKLIPVLKDKNVIFIPTESVEPEKFYTINDRELKRTLLTERGIIKPIGNKY